MSACDCALLASRKGWNPQPWSCSQTASAFISTPNFSYPRGALSRRLRSAKYVSSLRSRLSPMHTSRPFTVTRSLRSFTSFHLERSSLLLTHSKHRKRSLVVRSAVDIEPLETEWTPLITTCFSQGSGCSKLLSVLSGIFSDLSSNNFLYSVAVATTILGVSAAFYAYASRDRGDIRRNLLVSDRRSERQFESLEGWLILSGATPFSRFVTRRCPSLAPSSATRDTKRGEAVFEMEPQSPQYQRLCLHCHDGGTMAVDWPSHLDLEKSKDLDNMLLIIPGNAEGSEEKGIRRFVRVAEKRGYFPVILNPRGCGGSPLTTPRVFSAADSDDVRVVAHYIAKRRPWATIMGIGWGFGANMLSKYLGEEAYATPLTAAVCIDNPYNLDKVTQSVTTSRWNDLDQALTSELIKILDANQKLFQGESKGFDIKGGLAARSLREFETAISRVAHGYDSVQKFYRDVSSEVILERVQIPLLCIQHVEDYIGNQISVSPMGFDKNPYIMLLVSPPSIGVEDSRKCSNFPGTASEWSHDVALEWLAAVEVALLKGRHPLLNVVDLTVKPTKEWSPVGSQITATASAEEASEPASTTVLNAPNSYGIVESKIIDVTGDISDSSEHSKLGSQEPLSKSSVEAREPKLHRDNDVSHKDHEVSADGSGDAIEPQTGNITEEHSQQEKKKVETAKSSDALEEEENSSEELEGGQVQLAAESVMKVLDVTMPGTLSAEQKQQVLEAVGRGESLVGALQEAVPEDVRGKMASAVSAVVQAKGISLKTAGFGEKIPAPKLPDGLIGSLKSSVGGLTGSSGDSSPQKKSSEDGKKVENVALSESTVHENSASTADKNSTANAGSNGGKSNADLNEEKVAQNGSAQHGTSEDDTERNATAGISSHDNKMTDDSKKDTDGVQGEHATVAGSDPSQDTKTNTDGSKSADNLKKEAAVPHVEQASHESCQYNVGQAQETKVNFSDQTVHDSGKSEEKPDEKSHSNDSTTEQIPVQSRERDAAPDSRNNEDVKSDSHADVVTADPPGASGQEQDKKNEQEPGTTGGRGKSERKDEPNTQEPDTPTQTENSDQTSETSQSKGDQTSLQTEEVQQKPQNEVPAAEISVTASNPTSPPDSRQIPPVPSVGQALQALTGFDDATQMAVTNVFGVVENVLDELEKDNPPVENGSTASENEDQEEANRRKASTSENAFKMGDSGSEDDPRKYTLDGSKCESGEEHDKEVDCVTRGPAEVKRGPRNGSHAGNQVELTSKNIPSEIRSSVDQIGFSEKDKVCKDEVTRHAASLLDETRSQAQPSAVLPEIQHSPAYLEGGNEGRLAAISAEIDQEDQRNAEKNLEEDNVKNDDRKDTNSGGENQNMVRDVVMNALKLEIVRRVGAAGLDALGLDLEEEVSKVAHAVAEAVKQGQERVLDLASDSGGRTEGGAGSEDPASSESDSSRKLGILDGNSLVRTLGMVLSGPSTLTGFIPLGVLVGVVLAALGALFLIVTDDQHEEKNARELPTSSSKSVNNDPSSSEFDELDSENPVSHTVANDEFDEKQSRVGRDSEKGSLEKKDNARVEDRLIHRDSGNKDEEPTHGKLIGAVTAAMGATAAVASQRGVSTAVHREEIHLSEGSKTDGNRADSVHGSGEGDGLPQLVPGIAEKAISMVSPVVPKKEDGEVDQDRLVAMLAEIGQRGGILTLVGKAALLWGGLRGAMSLADRLLGFFRIKDRPLPQRLLGFVGMTILLWTPVLVPLLPTLLQQWSTKSPNGVADAGAGIGLYGAIFIVIFIWGKRVRGYDRPLVSYGLELLSRAKLRFLAVGMAVGVNLVAGYYGINWMLGYISFNWGSLLVENPSFPGPAATAILTFWKVLSLVGQSVSMALIVALVEELLFRAWLQEEIAVDLGNHWAIVLSALAFAVIHWSPPAVVGLWFLAVALAGARAKMDGDLSVAIGIHAGIVAAFSVVNIGGLTYYLPAAPAWLTGAYAGNPLAGALGTAMVAALAIVLYPRKQALPPAEDDEYDYSDDS